MSENSNTSLLELTAEIVSAYVVNNRLPATGLPDLIASVSASVEKLSTPTPEKEAAPTPAVNPKRSVHADHIVCLEDGKSFKSLKRHLATHHGMTPDEYRAKWNLAADYPMVAPEYATARSMLAKSLGLGRKPQAEPVAKPKRGRPAKPKV